VAVLLGPGRCGRRRLALLSPGGLHQAGLDQPEYRLADVELHQTRLVDDVLYAARTVEQGQDRALFRREIDLGTFHESVGGGEDDIQGRDLLLDQRPLVDPTSPLQEYALGVDPDPQRPLLWLLVRLEGERALGPGEQSVHRLFDLQADVTLELLSGDGTALDQDLAQPDSAARSLNLDCGGELLRVHQPILDQQVSEAVPPVDDGGVGDVPALEVDVSEIGAIGYRQAARLLP